MSEEGRQSGGEPNSLEAEHSWLISEAPKLAHQKFEPYLKLS